MREFFTFSKLPLGALNVLKLCANKECLPVSHAASPTKYNCTYHISIADFHFDDLIVAALAHARSLRQLCVYVCTGWCLYNYVCMCVGWCLYNYVCMCVGWCLYNYVCMCVGWCLYNYVCMCVGWCLYNYVCMCVGWCLYNYVCMCVLGGVYIIMCVCV